MKKTVLILIVVAFVLMPAIPVHTQTYIYKLSDNFQGNVPEAPPLVQIPNSGCRLFF